MWEAIIKLYQNSNLNRKMVFKEKLRNTKMGKGESVSSYITRLGSERSIGRCRRNSGWH
jgi:hypothetical protein